MKYFFDTSVLVPSFLDDHIHHEASHAALSNASLSDSCCAAHGLVEVYSALTRMPGKFRTRPEEALLFLDTVRARLSVIALERDEYWSVLKECSELQVIGGAVYDALLARCALKSGAEIIYTWNVTDFSRLGPEIAKRVRTP